MSRTGKCTNFGKCVVAYRGEAISAPDDDFVCPECRHPLNPVAGGKKTSRMALILGGIGVVVVLLLVLVVFVLLRLLNSEPETPAAGPVATEETAEPAAPGAPSEESASPAVAQESAEPPRESAATATVPEKINMDVDDEVNARVKTEVLKRIDLMPTISSDDKDKLYFSVERARQMGNIIKIPFDFGQRELTSRDIEALKEAFGDEQVKEVLQDPTAVLVVLGYADTKGTSRRT